MSARAKTETSDPWAREKITIHLSAARKAKLTRIAGGVDVNATPTQAVERAIELASRPEAAMGLATSASAPLEVLDRLDELRDELAQLAGEARAAMRGQEAAQRETASAANAILDLISGASGDQPIDERDMLDEPPERSLELGDWLRGELARIGKTGAASAIAKAQWTGMAKATAKLATLSLEAALVAVDGKQLKSKLALPREIRLSLVEIDGELFRAVAAKASRPLFIVVKAIGQPRMDCAFFASSDDGSLAERIGAYGA